MSDAQSRKFGAWVKATLIFLQSLARTFRLARNVGEARHVVSVIWKGIAWQLGRRDGAATDVTLTVSGVSHVIGLGTGELLTPQEIYVERSYEQFPGFIVQKGWV